MACLLDTVIDLAALRSPAISGIAVSCCRHLHKVQPMALASVPEEECRGLAWAKALPAHVEAIVSGRMSRRAV